MADIVVYKTIGDIRLRNHINIDRMVVIDRGAISSTLLRISYAGLYIRTICDGVDDI